MHSSTEATEQDIIFDGEEKHFFKFTAVSYYVFASIFYYLIICLSFKLPNLFGLTASLVRVLRADCE